MNITISGTGYVGLANAVLLAQHNTVTAFDISAEKIALLNNHTSPIKDKEIEDFLRNRRLSLSATGDKEKAYTGADFIIIATPTDYDPNRDYFDTSSVESVIGDIEKLSPSSVIIIKSTIPMGFTGRMRAEHPKLAIIFSPEFLREGKALYDNLYPSRIIVGDITPAAKKFGDLLLQGAVRKDTPVFYMPSSEAEAVKLFANTYLALRIAFFNELDTYTELKGLDAKSIIEGMCMDPRIGNYYNNPSFGYGGYCLPKDTKQIKANYHDVPNNLITAIVEANQTRKDHIVDMIKLHNPRTAGIYKLAMKSDSDNSRSSAVLEIIERLQIHHINVIIFDPALKEQEFYHCPVINSFEEFADKADIIIANRISDELEKARDKVYTRDVFARD